MVANSIDDVRHGTWHLIISSGLAAGLVSALVTVLSGRWDRKHQTREREAVTEHAALLRREEAHDAARAKFLPKAEEVTAWTDVLASELHWQVEGTNLWQKTTRPYPESDGGLLDLLREIMYGHPTRVVRVVARDLYDDIAVQVSEIVGDKIPKPTLDDALDWQKRAEDLIELIHARQPNATTEFLSWSSSRTATIDENLELGSPARTGLRG